MKRLTPFDLAAILDLTRCGWSASRIAATLGVGERTIKRIKAAARRPTLDRESVDGDAQRGTPPESAG